MLLGGRDAAQVERLGRDVQQYAVPLVAPDGLPSQGTAEYLFSVNVAPAYRGQILARFAASKWKAARAVVVSDSRDPTFTALATTFGKEWTKLGGTSPEGETYQSEAELTALAGRLAKMQPELIVLAASALDIPKLRRQLPEAHRQVPVLCGGEEPLTVLAGDGEASAEVYGVTVYVASQDKPGEQEFAKRYEERFHETPDRQAALAYDSVRLVAEAMRRAQATTGAKLRDELARMDNWDSVTGPLQIGLDHYARRAVFVVRLDKGHEVIVQRYEADSK